MSAPDDLTPASRGARLGAALVDTFLGATPYGLLVADATSDPVRLLASVAFLTLLGVQVHGLGSRGQTVGKRLVGIRVVMADTGLNGGYAPNVLKRVVLNSLLLIVPGYLLADPLFIFREDRRCLHDLIAGTTVVDGQP